MLVSCGETLLNPTECLSWKTTPCSLSATVYSVYSQVSGCLAAHVQPEDTSFHGIKGPIWHEDNCVPRCIIADIIYMLKSRRMRLARGDERCICSFSWRTCREEEFVKCIGHTEFNEKWQVEDEYFVMGKLVMFSCKILSKYLSAEIEEHCEKCQYRDKVPRFQDMKLLPPEFQSRNAVSCTVFLN